MNDLYCPTCDRPPQGIVAAGPDAEDIRFTCGCSVPVAVHREFVRTDDSGDTDDPGDGDESGDTDGDDPDADSSEGPA